MKNRFIIKLFQWLAAIVISCVIVNAFSFLYYRLTGWIDREGGATLSIWDPYTYIINAIEGYGVYKVDSRGYVNEDKTLGDEYVLCVGASFTQGKEVTSGKRYTDILNDMLSDGDECLAVYNVSQDGYFFPDIISGFKAIVSEFPSSDTIIIETCSTSFSSEQLDNALIQRQYNPYENGDCIIDTLSTKQRIKIKVKEALPLLSIMKKQSQTRGMNNSSVNDVANNAVNNAVSNVEKKEFNYDSYSAALDDCLKLIRSEYDGKLIIMYHNNQRIGSDGNMIPDDSQTKDIFSDLCERNGITFVDTTQAFLKAYQEDYSVGYGFNNTSIGIGHLNEAGHRIIADELYRVLKGCEE